MPGGQVHVPYEHDLEFDQAIHVRVRTGGTWSAAERVVPGFRPSIAVDATGRESLVYWDFSAPLGLAAAMQWATLAWVVRIVDAEARPGTEVVLRPSVAVGADGVLRVSYGSRDERGGEDLEIWYARGDAGTLAEWPDVTLRACRVRGVSNPPRHGATLLLALPSARGVCLGLVDVRGWIVRDLHAGALPPGEHAIVWDGRNRGGEAVAPGVYIVRLQAGKDVVIDKLVVQGR